VSDVQHEYSYRDAGRLVRSQNRGPEREDERVERYLRTGSVTHETPERGILAMQRMLGNRATALAMVARGAPSVQRFGISDALDTVFGSRSTAGPIEKLAMNPVAWGHFKAYAKKEVSTENTEFYEEYIRAKTHGGGGNNQKLYDMAMTMKGRELNIPHPQRNELKKKAEHVFWERPLSWFETIKKSVVGNLSDTYLRFKDDPLGMEAAKAMAKGESWREKSGRFFGEKSKKPAEKTNSTKK